MFMRGIVFCGIVMLAGCASVGRLDPEPGKSVDLSGSWLLNRDASEDPAPLFEKLRPRPVRYRPGDDGMGDDTGPQQQQGGNPQGGGRRRQSQQAPLENPTRNDNFARQQVTRMLRADLARAEQITITQSAERFKLDYGSQVRSFTPGGISVVSASWGVADQSSGWKGGQYLIEVKPQQGVASDEKFSLSPDGKHLLEELRLGGRDYPAVQLKRVYDRTDKPLPRGLPTND